MPQTVNSVDPEFVSALKTNISGIYYTQVEDLTPEKITAEFSKAIHDPDLVADEEFMQNLFFLLRKKELRDLNPEVEKLLASNKLKPGAETSAMKTLYAFGNQSARDRVDERLSRLLRDWLQSPDRLKHSVYMDAAERIGGAKSLAILKQGQVDITAQQRQVEQNEPDNHMQIGQLDKRRAELEEKVYTLTKKSEILAKSEAERALNMASLYIRRTKQLSAWGCKELVDHPSASSIAAVRTFLSSGIESLLPTGGLSSEDRAKRLLDYRLRGTGLLEAMKAPLTAEEQKLLQDHSALIKSREEYFRTRCDWEDVLDRL